MSWLFSTKRKVVTADQVVALDVRPQVATSSGLEIYMAVNFSI